MSISVVEHNAVVEQPVSAQDQVRSLSTMASESATSYSIRQRLASHFSPQEVMEIVLLVGFWKMYNTMHTAMGAPLEDPALRFEHWVRVRADEGYRHGG